MDALIRIGEAAPDVSLPDLVGRPHRLSHFRRRLVVVNFWSAECPHAARVDEELHKRCCEWGERVVWVSIASNANESLDLLRRVAAQRALPLVLLDRNHQAADLFGAITTPHLFVIDAQGILRYQGAFDEVTFRQKTPTRHYLAEAVAAVLAGKEVDLPQTPPYGCSIVRY